MSIYDYHRIYLHPEIWQHDELALNGRAAAQLHSQISRRFPDAVGLYLLGELVGHYYSDTPVLDVAIMAPSQLIPAYAEESKYASGYRLVGTNVTVKFHIFHEDLKPEILASKFGPVYNMNDGSWIGIKVHGLTEMARPEAILQRIRWTIYKDKLQLSYEPPDWRIIIDAAERLSFTERARLLDNIREVIARLRYNVIDTLQNFPDAQMWHRASDLNQILFVEDSNPVNRWAVGEALEKAQLPAPVLLAMLNTYRYFSVLWQLIKLDQRLLEDHRQEEESRGPLFMGQEY